MIDFKKFPWKTTIISLAIVIFLVSPLGRQIYNDFKESNEKKKKELSAQKIKTANEKILQEFSKIIVKDKLSLPNLPNQKVSIKYKATSIDEISLIFDITPFTAHKAHKGKFNVYFVDVDGFTFYDFSISESSITNIVGDRGEIIGGQYETSFYMDLSKLKRLDSIKVGTSISKERLSLLSGEYDIQQEEQSRLNIERINKLKKKELEEERIAKKDAATREVLKKQVRIQKLEELATLRLKWRKIKKGLSRTQVRNILGEPITINKLSYSENWTFDRGRLSFRKDVVDTWTEPPFDLMKRYIR